MRESIRMWRYTRMVVLTAICAAVYLAALLPFKFFTIVPGFTEIRPGASMPVLLGFLFGPAGAWGSGLGNVIGDLLGGMFGVASVFGFIGNFLMGYLPYKVWRTWRGDRPPVPKTAVDFVVFEFVVLLGAVACAFTIGWGVDLLKMVPFVVLANAITINNAIFCPTIVTALIFLIYPRVAKWGLRDIDVMEPSDFGRPGPLRHAGVVVAIGAVLVGMILGNVLGAGGVNVGTTLYPVAAALVAAALVL